MSKTLQVRIGKVSAETRDIRRFELCPLEGLLPAFTAGAHIDLHLASGQVRSYSLLNSQNDRRSYEIAVALEPQGRGGSRYIHDNLKTGDVLTISGPRNLFPLAESAGNSVLIGGGIGVTPMLSMARRLSDLGKAWKLHYCCRSRAAAGFLADLDAYSSHVALRFDDQESGFLDFASLLAADADTHFYCCGPNPMMNALLAAAEAAGVARDRVHIEYFQPTGEIEPQGGFEVELARTGRVIAIPAGRTVLEVLEEEGVPTSSSCESGICGECQVTVISGEPDHKDLVLSDAERASNKVMMICCSGSKSPRLVFDL